MQRSKFLFPLAVCLGVVSLGTASYLWWSSAQLPQGPPRFVICSECGHEIKYNAKLDGTVCKQCNAGKLQASTVSQQTSGEPMPVYRNPLAIFLILLTAALGGAYAFFLFKNRPATAAKEELPYNYYRCEKCKRRLKITMRNYPRKILCPTCKTEFDVPAAMADKAPSR